MAFAVAHGTKPAAFGPFLRSALVAPSVVAVLCLAIAHIGDFPPRSREVMDLLTASMACSALEVLVAPIAITRLARNPDDRKPRNLAATAIGTAVALPALAIYLISVLT